MPIPRVKVNSCRRPSSVSLVRRSRASPTRVKSLPNSIILPAFHRVFPRNSTLVLPPFHQQPCPVTTPFSLFRFPLLCSCLFSPIPESRGSTRTAFSSKLYYILYLHTRSLLPPAHTPYHTPSLHLPRRTQSRLSSAVDEVHTYSSYIGYIQVLDVVHAQAGALPPLSCNLTGDPISIGLLPSFRSYNRPTLSAPPLSRQRKHASHSRQPYARVLLASLLHTLPDPSLLLPSAFHQRGNPTIPRHVVVVELALLTCWLSLHSCTPSSQTALIVRRSTQRPSTLQVCRVMRLLLWWCASSPSVCLSPLSAPPSTGPHPSSRSPAAQRNHRHSQHHFATAPLRGAVASLPSSRVPLVLFLDPLANIPGPIHPSSREPQRHSFGIATGAARAMARPNQPASVPSYFISPLDRQCARKEKMHQRTLC